VSVRKRLGLIFINNEKWVGGTYYIINLINALNVLTVEDKPEIVAFSNEEDFTKLQKETQYPYLKYELFEQGKLWVLARLINKVTAKVLNKVIFKQQYKGYLDALFITQRSEYLDNIPLEKRIYWIADFQDKYYPNFFGEIGAKKKDESTKWIHSNAKKLIFSSETVNKDWKQFYPNFKGETKVIHFAVTHPQYDSLDIRELKVKYDLPNDYFFAPNQFWAHKNHLVVIKAAEILKGRGQPVVVAFSGKEYDSRNPGYTESLKSYVYDNQLGDVVKFLGFLDRREQLKIMKHAKAVIQPSLFEGWSTVIEDAMATNSIVIASNLEVNLEQLGNLGHYFQPHDENELANLLTVIESTDNTVSYNYQNKQKVFSRNIVEFFFG
jgi:glycosyltransferase involved in cell wall biosynthesis